MLIFVFFQHEEHGAVEEEHVCVSLCEDNTAEHYRTNKCDRWNLISN